ncbi:MAG: EAL domain-containing protein [Actinomycetota bacterium]
MNDPDAGLDGQLVPSAEQLPEPVIVLDAAGRCRFANDRALELSGWTSEEILGTSILDLVHEDDLELAARRMESVVDRKIGELLTLRVRCSDSSWTEVELRAMSTDVDGEPSIVLIGRSTADRYRLELDGGDDELLRSVIAHLRTMIVLVAADGTIRAINGAVTRNFGHDPEAIKGTPFVDYLHPEERSQVINAVVELAPHASVPLEARFSHGDEWVTVEFTVTNLCDDPVLRGYLVSGQVAAALTAARSRVDFLAHHDNRTGLLNRDGFFDEASDLIANGGGLGLMIVDIAKFRSINELYGEPAGDAVLTALAERIDEIRWPGLVAARFGGDEFVVALRSASDGAIEMVRERVRRSVVEPVNVGGVDIHIALRTATAFEERPTGLDSLLANASAEMVRVKRNAVPEAPGARNDGSIGERRRQVDELRRALDCGEIQPFYQPIVEHDGRVTAVEALVRWVHPMRGVLGVGHILPLAQMAGLATAIDQVVLDQSLRFSRRLADAGHGHIEVHVNVDPKVIGQATFAGQFLERCRALGADPNQIVVELTETDLLAPGKAALDNLHTLRTSGTHISIDDFGTGYSSLSHLLELPVDGVKIDRRFVAGIDIDAAATNLTTAILGLSESLQLGCVAEGVEQPYQLDRLESLGCRAFQGWLFSAAVSPDDVFDLLPRIPMTPPAVDPRTTAAEPVDAVDA